MWPQGLENAGRKWGEAAPKASRRREVSDFLSLAQMSWLSKHPGVPSPPTSGAREVVLLLWSYSRISGRGPWTCWEAKWVCSYRKEWADRGNFLLPHNLCEM